MNSTPSFSRPSFKSESFNSTALWEQLQHALPARRWLVGFSGGLDSTALLAALVAAKPPQPILAIHINHGLSPEADAWQAHCEARCREWNIDFCAENVKVQKEGRGIEDAARRARHDAFRAHMQAGDVLLLGHHRDDQAETILFRLLRGTGLRGLAAMAPERSFGLGRLFRPLLPFSREQLAEFVAIAGLSWREDPSNRNSGFDRNYLRHHVLPLLKERWPGFERRWLNTARACQESVLLNRELGLLDLAACGERAERLGWSVDLAALSSLAAHRRSNVLRTWLMERGLDAAERKQLAEIERQFFAGESKTTSCVAWASTALRQYGGRLHLTPHATFSLDGNAKIWRLDSSLLLPDGSRLTAGRARGGLHPRWAQVEVRWRQGGERCRPAGRSHSQTLKKLLQEYGLEPWLRERLPLLYVDGQLAAVGDLWVCEGFTAPEGEKGYQIKWALNG